MSEPAVKPIFKNSVGIHYLRGLFYEETASDKSTVIYTLKDDDHEGYPSLYRLYMETADPTEWRFAKAYLQGWNHWEKLQECVWFQPYLERWRRELQLSLSSTALARIISESKTNSRDSFTANRYLLEQGWMPKEKGKAGRPTKDSIKAEASRIAGEAKQLEEDYTRIQRAN